MVHTLLTWLFVHRQPWGQVHSLCDIEVWSNLRCLSWQRKWPWRCVLSSTCGCTLQVCSCVYFGVQQGCVFPWFWSSRWAVLLAYPKVCFHPDSSKLCNNRRNELSSHVQSHKIQVHIRVKSTGGCEHCLSYFHDTVLLPSFPLFISQQLTLESTQGCRTIESSRTFPASRLCLICYTHSLNIHRL